MGPYEVLSSRARVDPGPMSVKGDSALPKYQWLEEPYYLIFSALSRHTLEKS